MSDTPQGPGPGTSEGGYGYPTLEQEVTPEVLGADSEERAEVGTESAGDGDPGAGPTPGELVEEPPAVEPTD
jgi:hypothetical protein